MHRTLMGMWKGVWMIGLAGCANTAAAPVSGQASSPEQGNGSHCPDPLSDCAQNNGTGVYTAEAGFAGIGPTQLMITRFINNHTETERPEFVTFQGRYFDATYQEWVAKLTEPGKIVSATYHGKPVQVLSVREQDTSPTWTVMDENGPISVVGDQIVDLALAITFDVTHPAPASYRYVLEFDLARVVGDDRSQQTVHGFALRWREASDGPTTPYCFAPDATGTLEPDPVVFQQGMSVDPVNGAVTRDASTSGLVTLSCGQGALATVYRWGYQYRAPGETAYFDAGIPMKRASYCADARFFTIAGTAIQIADDHPFIDESPIKYTEAWWTADGALCFNAENARHSDMAQDFTGVCKDVLVTACPPATLPTGPYIVEGPVQLAP